MHTKQVKSRTSCVLKWTIPVIAVAVLAIPPLAGMRVFVPTSEAQQKGTAQDPPKGQVGYITIDPVEIPLPALPDGIGSAADAAKKAKNAPKNKPISQVTIAPVDPAIPIPKPGAKAETVLPALPPIVLVPGTTSLAASDVAQPVFAPAAEAPIPTVSPWQKAPFDSVIAVQDLAKPPAALAQVQPPPVQQPGQVIPLPQPRPLVPFGPGQVRMPLLGDPSATPLGATPRPTEKELAEYAKYIKGFIDPNNTLDLIQGRARLMLLKDTPKRIQISDEKIANYTVFGAKDITLLGKEAGTTVLNLWFTNADDKTKETVLSYLVRVFPDPEAKERLERVFKALEIEINKNFPDSIVRLKLVGDKVLVTGQAHDILDATQILRIVSRNTPGGTADDKDLTVKNPTPTVYNLPQPTGMDGATPGAENYIYSGHPNVINMMRVAGVQQVMLKVVVAEVNRTAARSIGMNLSYQNRQGITVFENRTGGLVIPAGGLNALNNISNQSGGGGLANLPVNLDNGQITLAINALKRMSYAKSLAEPTLVTLNGRPASFLAGGQFPVPVVAGNAVGGLQGVSFVPFGVQLLFTPFITDKDRIRLTVSATVSTRDTSTGTNVGNSAVPGLNARNFTSTIEMRDGQTLAVAGLIQTNSGSDRDQLPFLGTIPFLNRFTGFDRTSAGEQELVVLITPELVQPMHPHQLQKLPGSDLFEPSDLEFYLLGRLEGRRPVDFRSPVMNDFHRIRQYNRVEQTYIFGPTGYHDIQAIPK